MKAQVGDITVAYTIEGHGPWVTLSHSLAASSVIWEAQVAALREHFTVLTYDTRGHGGTTSTAGPYTLKQLARDALGLLDHLGIERTHWIGLSMGGMIGQVLAIQSPTRLDRVVLADTTARLPANLARTWTERGQAALETGMSVLVEPTLGRWFTDAFRHREQELMARIGAIIASTPPEGYAGCCAAVAQVDTVDQLGILRHQAMVLVGAQDPSTPPSMALEMTAHWQGAHLVVLPNAAHLAHVEQPDAFNRALIRFLLTPEKD